MVAAATKVHPDPRSVGHSRGSGGDPVWSASHTYTSAVTGSPVTKMPNLDRAMARVGWRITPTPPPVGTGEGYHGVFQAVPRLPSTVTPAAFTSVTEPVGSKTHARVIWTGRPGYVVGWRALKARAMTRVPATIPASAQVAEGRRSSSDAQARGFGS